MLKNQARSEKVEGWSASRDSPSVSQSVSQSVKSSQVKSGGYISVYMGVS